jgi:UDP-N-acetylglucosamine 2-epimerase (non-hydrolysing)
LETMNPEPARAGRPQTGRIRPVARAVTWSPAKKKLRVLTVLGTRPEAIKLAPLIGELRRRPGIVSKVCVTAQHREMLDQVLELFQIAPDYDLNLMRKDQTLPHLAAAVFQELAPILLSERPDWVVVQGDTTTAAIAALGAFYQRAKVAHVEAGLRSHDKWHPFPEEINRRVAGVIADLRFAPTEQSRQNLLHEGVPASCVKVTGNTIIDALQWIQTLPWNPDTLGEHASLLKSSGSSRLVLVTVHRRENFGAPMLQICSALRTLAERYPDIRILYPVHKNPNVWEPVHRLLGDVSNIVLLPPLDYLTLVHFMMQSYIVLTDSGGIQEEAPALGVPALVLREVTERPEGVASGNVKLVGSDPQRIVSETARLLEDPSEHLRMAQAVNPYGDGHAAERIADALEAF